MMKTLRLILVGYLCLLMSCTSLMLREDIDPSETKKQPEIVVDQQPMQSITNATPVEEAPAVPEMPKPKKLTKRIVDQDHKKNEEDKELKKRVVVLPLLDKLPSRSSEVLKNAQNAFMDALNETDEMIALDSSSLNLNLKKYIKDNVYDLSAISKDSQKAAVSSLLEARIIAIRFKDEANTKIDNTSYLKSRNVDIEVVVQIRLYNIRMNQELFNTVKTVNISDEDIKVAENLSSEVFFNRNPELTQLLIKDALLDFTPKLVESLQAITWEGRIAAMQGDRIYLNVGQISGVQIGDILKVVDDANEIYDTELGHHVGKVQGRLKGTLEVVGFFGQDGAVSVIHSGAGFKENDRVEIYQ